MKRTPNPRRVHVSSSNFRQLVRHTACYVRVPYAGHHNQDDASRSVVRLGRFGRLDSASFTLQHEVVAAETLRHQRLHQRMDAQGENTVHDCGALRNSHETWTHRQRSPRADVS
ncbi:hypothetical protein COCMIDRAFT_38349 [Bipolaris oryzae ATCC 44560]|uniref:Uncharacterized protein n=1 Tax=Bipolaris oryzae ATCC 44560 TaxID=930090 RepID=W6Z868_COCMI|nr:uncharacterized protein COCMIDRAFT_38349 [Bipolaris oryzae ATCC 44560]EUC43759.1 hypothetical protein COCMIDRAFT_38349 [Bipolaris oryzae ATCC 44560]